MIELVLLLLPLAAISGWYCARQTEHSNLQKDQKRFSKEYLAGLNFLLNEQPDKAVELLIKMLEIDTETVETHLALGNLFRRRGEIARAIRIHQNLIARPQLAREQRIQALLALAQDYLAAGVFDRAERLFLEVVEAGEQVTTSLYYLLDIYQQQKQWEKAIATAGKLQAAGEAMQIYIAQYYCELAEEAQTKAYSDAVYRYLKDALQADKNCARASLIQGRIAGLQEQWQLAIQAYQRVCEQDPDYLSEAVNPLAECYKHLPEQRIKLIDYLQECLAKYPRISVVLLLADYLRRFEGNQAAAEFIAGQLRQRPSIRGLRYLIELQLLDADETIKANLLILKDVADNLLRNKPIYRCQQCGFQGKLLYWQCPGCKSWSTVRPIHGLEGD